MEEEENLGEATDEIDDGNEIIGLAPTIADAPFDMSSIEIELQGNRTDAEYDNEDSWIFPALMRKKKLC